LIRRIRPGASRHPHRVAVNVFPYVRYNVAVYVFTEVPKIMSTTEKVDESHAPLGSLGQTFLAGGDQVALRLWEEAPGDAEHKEPYTRPYETVGYVIEGKLEITVDEETIMLVSGQSWVVHAEAKRTYRIHEPLVAVEATAPPARHT